MTPHSRMLPLANFAKRAQHCSATSFEASTPWYVRRTAWARTRYAERAASPMGVARDNCALRCNLDFASARLRRPADCAGRFHQIGPGVIGCAQLLEILLAATRLVRVSFAGESTVGTGHITRGRLPSDRHVNTVLAALSADELHQGALGNLLSRRHAGQAVQTTHPLEPTQQLRVHKWRACWHWLHFVMPRSTGCAGKEF